jgi:hypothetical protein
MTTEVEIGFQGSEAEQSLAQEVFELMRLQGALFAENAPIRQSLDNLAVYLAGRHQVDVDELATQIDSALRKNEQIFAREEREDEVIYVTSRARRLPNTGYDHDPNMLRTRLYMPENPLPTDDISVVVSLNRPALTTVEPVFISDYWQQQAGLAPIPTDAAPTFANDDEEPVVADQPPALEPVVAELFIPDEAAIEVEGVAADALVEDAPVDAEVPMAAIAPVVDDEPVVEQAPVETVPVETVVPIAEPSAAPIAAGGFTLADGVSIDLGQPIGALLESQGTVLQNRLREALEADPLRRIVFFGDEALPEAQISGLGKNDLRRIKDYIVEVGEPVQDGTIISDLYNRRTRDEDFERLRFSLNYRLAREKDFSFVGVRGARLWSVNTLPAIGTKRIKAGEMAQILSYLVEGYDDSLQDIDADSIAQSGQSDHLLSFFEWHYGILPLTAALRALLPEPLLPNQRTSVLRFHSPQNYTDYVAELRYPTGNRGGWLQGLEAFFHDYLVPGALLTITRTDEANVFNIAYEEAPATTDRLLSLDEKKNKLAFVNITYYCTVDDDLVPNQQRYGKLRNLKYLPMNERRREDAVLEHVFETVGEQVGTREDPLYSASLQDLFMGMNVLRPSSRALLRHLLEQGERFETESNDTYLYRPEPEEIVVDEDEDEYDDEYDDEE